MSTPAPHTRLRLAMPLLGLFLAAGLGAISWHLHRLSSQLVETSALHNVQVLTAALTEFRTLYTSEVVSPLVQQGMTASHDYQQRAGNIPLPATLALLLGERIGAHTGDVQVRLYSPYPFPWRVASGGLRDDFAEDAWRFLRDNPEQAFHRVERVDGQLLLRYASADRMRPDCVNCHQQHPDSPKRNWAVGDVRGVLEISRPIDASTGLARSLLFQTFFLLAGLLGVSVLGLSLVLRRLHAARELAETQAHSAEAANRELSAEVAQRIEVEADLQESRRQSRTLLSNLPGMAYRSRPDPAHSKEFVSEGALPLTGYTPDDLLSGRVNYLDLIEASDRVQITLQEDAALEAGLPFRLTYRIRTASGDQKWVWEQGRGIRDSQDQLIAIEGFITDISERVRAEHASQQAQLQAEQANQAKTAFLANMSHEIRTPLNAILGYAQILRRDSRLEPALRETVQTIERSGEHLLGLLTDVLDLAKMDSGQHNLDHGDFDLGELLHHVATQFAAACAEKQLQWQFEAPARPLPPVRGDEAKLRQVLSKLLGNAIKFTGHGEVALRVEALGNERYRFEVRDSGPGLAADARAGLFEPFHLTELGAAKGGAGLGLAICQRQVMRMGGELRVDSNSGAGSRFHFELTLPSTDHADAVALADSESALLVLPPDRIYHALVVDDVADNRRVLTGMLEPAGFTVSQACHGAEALERVAEQRPDLVLMDIRMPVMDGFAALAELRRRYGEQAPPCVAITASSPHLQQGAYLDAGFRQMIPKPFRIEALYRCLQDVLQVQLQPAQRTVAPLAAADPNWRLPPALQQRLLEALDRNWLSGAQAVLEELAKLDDEGQRFAAEAQAMLARFELQGLRERVDGLAAGTAPPKAD